MNKKILNYGLMCAAGGAIGAGFIFPFLFGQFETFEHISDGTKAFSVSGLIAGAVGGFIGGVISAKKRDK